MGCSDNNIFYYGKSASLPVKCFLKCGNLDVVYENGCLRYISAGGKELIRSIYAAVRDRNWGTILPEITNEKMVKSSDSFSIHYEAHYKNAEIDFWAEYQIEGRGNKIEFSFHGKALCDFWKNRIGFCVLHPLDGVKGEMLKIFHAENSFTEISFPDQVSPTSPATNIQAMEWRNGAACCRLDFEGDLWEMEDHRNWTDSSYKTYCTPLSIPFPAMVQEGGSVEQKITFAAYFKELPDKFSEECTLSLLDIKISLPEIGTTLGSLSLSFQECNILKQLGLRHLRYDLKFSKPDWGNLFSVSIENSVKLNVPLELVLHFSQNGVEEVKLLRQFLTGYQLKPKFVWFIDEKTRRNNNELVNKVLAPLRKIFPDVPVGGGTDAYFAEFNRNRFDASQLDFVTFAVCPQVHAFDNDSLVENMTAQTDTVESAQVLYPGKEVHVSPVTLKQRFNVVATGEEPPVPEDQLPPQVDERQMSLFAAGWTLGSLASLAHAGAGRVTYYQTTGWKGIIQGEDENSKPHLFAGRKNDIFPVYHLLRFIQKVNPVSAKVCRSSHALKFTGLVIENESDRFLIIASHASDPLRIVLIDLILDVFISLTEDDMEEALKDAAFLDRADWKNVEGCVEVKPYALLFAKIKMI